MKSIANREHVVVTENEIMICDELAEALDFTHGYVVTCEVTSEYSSMEPWLLESTKWSRSIHDGLAGSCL